MWPDCSRSSTARISDHAPSSPVLLNSSPTAPREAVLDVLTASAQTHPSSRNCCKELSAKVPPSMLSMFSRLCEMSRRV
jgi:hypothetical protein